MPNRMDQFRTQMFDAISEMNRAIAERKKKREREALERELLGEPLESFKLRELAEDQDLSQELKRAQIERALREPARRALPVTNEPPSDPVIRNGMIWNGRQWVKAPRIDATSTGNTERDALDKELRRKFGIDWTDMEDIMARGATPNETDPNSLSFKTKAGVDLSLDRSKLMPYVNRGLSIYRNQTGNGVDPNASAMAAQAQPQVTGKQLDKMTALEILREAGGDKEKARAIAKERGYSF